MKLLMVAEGAILVALGFVDIAERAEQQPYVYGVVYGFEHIQALLVVVSGLGVLVRVARFGYLRRLGI